MVYPARNAVSHKLPQPKASLKNVHLPSLPALFSAILLDSDLTVFFERKLQFAACHWPPKPGPRQKSNSQCLASDPVVYPLRCYPSVSSVDNVPG